MLHFDKATSLFIIIPLHLIFLGAIGYENLRDPFLLGMLVVFIIALVYAYRRLPKLELVFCEQDVFDVLFVVMGGLYTNFLSVRLGWGPVMGAAAVGLIGSFVPQLFKKLKRLTSMPTAMYCGAFVGMSATTVLNSYLAVLGASLAAGVIYVLAKNLFPGFGGKLGTIAFGGVVVFVLLTFLIG